MQPELQNQQPHQQVPQASANAVIQGAPQSPVPGTIASGPTPASPTPDKAPEQKKSGPISTQNTLLFSEMRENMIIMSDGSFRAVVECESINFDLMSAREREGIEFSYQNFINSLYFPIQILIRSQRIDITPYLERLAEIRRNNDNMLLGVLMDDYINFIDQISQEANIMDKSFFVIVPYYSSPELEKTSTQSKNIFSLLFSSKNSEITHIDRTTYDKAVTEINNRVQSVIGGLFNIGIHSVRLNTKELAELFYNFNNPDTAVREPFIDFNKIGTIYTKKGESETQQKPLN